MAENYYNSTLTAAQIEAVLAGVNGVTGLVKRKTDGTFEEGSEVYWATYGVSTNAEIETAYQAGRPVACKYSSKIYYLSSRNYSTPTHTFAALLTNNIDYISVTSNVWSAERKSLQLTSDKVTTLSEQSTDAQYPSAKCVYDALLLRADVFVALYGTTTVGQVEAAYQAGKVVACIDGQFVYFLMNRVNSASFVFINWSQIDYYGNQSGYPEYRRITLDANGWTRWANNFAVERTDSRTKRLDSYSSDYQYPSAKCVYDALLLKADAADLTAHTEATDNPHAVTKVQVGLGSVDNTADADKPVSTAQQTALDLKAPLESPALTGMPTAPTAAEGTDTTQVATTAFAKAVAESKAADAVATKALRYDTDVILTTAQQLTARKNAQANELVTGSAAGAGLCSADCVAAGALAVTVIGNGVQDGTPTPDNPITPQFVSGNITVAGSDQVVTQTWSNISLKGIPLGASVPAAIQAEPELMAGVWHDGTQYIIGDSIQNWVLVDGVYRKRRVQRILVTTFVGAAGEGWALYTGKFWTTIPGTISNESFGLCNKYPVGYRFDTVNNTITFGNYHKLNQVNVYDNRFASLAEFLADLATSPLVVYTVLATPVVTLSDPEELSAVPDVTNVYTTSAVTPYIGAEHPLDVKKYIDKQFTALTNAVVSLGGNI